MVILQNLEEVFGAANIDKLKHNLGEESYFWLHFICFEERFKNDHRSRRLFLEKYDNEKIY